MPATSQPIAIRIEEAIPLDTNPEISITVKFDTEIARKAGRFSESLQIARDCMDDTSVTAAHLGVIQLVAHSNQAIKTKEAISIVKSANREYRTIANSDGLKAAMLDHLFTQRRVQGGHLIVESSVEGLEIPPDYWNDNTINLERMDSWLPPLPTRNPLHPIEQRAAYANVLLLQNPVFGVRFTGLLEAAINNLMDDAMEAGRKETEVDGEGFRPDSVGGVVDVSPDAAN